MQRVHNFGTGFLDAGQLTGEYILNFFIYHDIYLDTPLRCRLQQTVNPIGFIPGWRPSQVQLRTQPPVHNPDLTLGLLERHGQGPEVSTAVDKPLSTVLGARGREAVIAVVHRVVQGMAEVVQVGVRMLLDFELGADFLGQLLRVSLKGVEGVFGAIEKGAHLD